MYLTNYNYALNLIKKMCGERIARVFSRSTHLCCQKICCGRKTIKAKFRYSGETISNLHLMKMTMNLVSFYRKNNSLVICNKCYKRNLVT